MLKEEMDQDEEELEKAMLESDANNPEPDPVPEDELTPEPEPEKKPISDEEIKRGEADALIAQGDSAPPENKGNLGVALKEERELTKTLRADMDGLTRKVDKIGELKDIIVALKSGQPEPSPEPESNLPDAEDDPVGNAQGRIEGIEKTLATSAAVTKENEAFQELGKNISANEQTFKADNPDYPEAVGFARNYRAKELAVLGYTDPVEVNNIIGNEVLEISLRALKGGENPAGVLYNLATHWGYNKAPAEAPTPKPAEDELETIKKGQEMAGSMPIGGEEAVSVSAKSLAAMPDGPEFDVAWEKFFNE